MRTLLVDFRIGGHHLEYANRLLYELEAVGIDANMLGSVPNERYEKLFDQGQISYLFREDYDFAAKLERHPDEARRTAIQRVQMHVNSAYDVVHFLHADEVVEECYHEMRNRNLPPVVGSLNGAFFRHRSFSDVPLTLTADRLFHPLISDYLPIRSNKATLYRCLRDRVFNHVLVPTDVAKAALTRYVPEGGDELLTTVPDPVEPWFYSLPEQASARHDLGLSVTHPILLCFGEMRSEKGIDLLLDALKSYQGPRFTMLLAGSATDVNEANIENVQNPAVELYARPEFIPEAEIPLYFAAADGAVLPYRQTFGELRPSGVFQKACASRLPIVGPDFGFFRQRIEKHSLGTTFKADDATSLALTLETFLESMMMDVDEDAFEQYVSTQTYRQLAEKTVTVYRTIVE